MQDFEQLYKFKEIAEAWHISPGLASQIFKNRPGIINVGKPNRPSYRVPASLVIEVMVERGYPREQAELIFRRNNAANAA